MNVPMRRIRKFAEILGGSAGKALVQYAPVYGLPLGVTDGLMTISLTPAGTLVATNQDGSVVASEGGSVSTRGRNRSVRLHEGMWQKLEAWATEHGFEKNGKANVNAAIEQILDAGLRGR